MGIYTALITPGLYTAPNIQVLGHIQGSNFPIFGIYKFNLKKSSSELIWIPQNSFFGFYSANTDTVLRASACHFVKADFDYQARHFLGGGLHWKIINEKVDLVLYSAFP